MPKGKQSTLDQIWQAISTLDKEIKTKTKEKLKHHKQLNRMLQKLGIVAANAPTKKKGKGKKSVKADADKVYDAAMKAIGKNAEASKAELSKILRAEGINIRSNNPQLAKAIKDAKKKK
ncbi:MAG: hypothetical protein IT366_19555 [Candidatus Hydrogenedentes bacterium]|nr:hypothetical protein [Candidatus Hydrogenedentota bacterium]